MKAERRHELKENSLRHYLYLAPWIIQKYQSQILLAIVLISLAFVVVRYRSNAAAERLASSQQSLDLAGESLQRLKFTVPYGATMAAEVQQRQESFTDGLKYADDVLEKAPSDQPGLKAMALLDKGDLNFEMANFPELPGASTRPELQPAESRDILLKNAAEAYTEVLKSYLEQSQEAAAAHFGLAAVAEDRAALSGWKDQSQWGIAKSEYQAILDGNSPSAYKMAANSRLQLLPKLEQPVVMELNPEATTQASEISLPEIQGPQAPALPTTQAATASHLKTVPSTQPASH